LPGRQYPAHWKLPKIVAVKHAEDEIIRQTLIPQGSEDDERSEEGYMIERIILFIYEQEK